MPVPETRRGLLATWWIRRATVVVLIYITAAVALPYLLDLTVPWPAFGAGLVGAGCRPPVRHSGYASPLRTVNGFGPSGRSGERGQQQQDTDCLRPSRIPLIGIALTAREGGSAGIARGGPGCDIGNGCLPGPVRGCAVGWDDTERRGGR